jgi:hypothetical protein
MSIETRGWSLLFAGCLAICMAAFALRMTFFPDAFPIALADSPHAFWEVELAFLLRAAELSASFGALLLVIAGLGALIYPRPEVCAAEIPAQRRQV